MPVTAQADQIRTIIRKHRAEVRAIVARAKIEVKKALDAAERAKEDEIRKTLQKT